MGADMTKYLIPEWRSAWKFVSVQLAALLTLLLSLEPVVPQITAYLPPHYAAYLSAAILVARIVQQAVTASKEAHDVPKDS
jgi:hypothetical protein